jgi:hypothetical protein
MYDWLGSAPGGYRTDFRIAKLFDRKKRYYELPVADNEQRNKPPAA